MSGISTHILDTALGQPAAGISVSLFREGVLLHIAKTNADGRVPSLLPDPLQLSPGVYSLRFAVGGPFFPEIIITFRVEDAGTHYHVPLLLSPFGYSTYRGRLDNFGQSHVRQLR